MAARRASGSGAYLGLDLPIAFAVNKIGEPHGDGERGHRADESFDSRCAI